MELTEKEIYIISQFRLEGVVDEYFNAMQRPDWKSRGRSGGTGFVFEDWLREEVKSRGYGYEPPPNGSAQHDCSVNKFLVQAKASGLSETTIDIRSHKNNSGKQGRAYRVTEVDVMALKNLNTGRVYFVPTSELIDPAKPGFLLGRVRWDDIAHYENAWGVFEGKAPERPEVFDPLDIDMFEELEINSNGQVP